MNSDENLTLASVAHPPKKKVQTWRESAIELIKFLIVAAAIALPFRYFIMQPFVVSGSSMVPTFQDKNYLLVDELSYDFKSPARGDVIIFRPPENMKVFYIKRVIGLPGETIEIHNKQVTITNTEHPEGFILAEPYISEMTNDTLKRTIGAGEYFVMGDNRPFSSDSRSWGFVPRKNISGRAFIRLFPLKELSTFPGEFHNY